MSLCFASYFAYFVSFFQSVKYGSIVTFLDGVVVNVKSRQPGGTEFLSCYRLSFSHLPFFSFLFCFVCLFILLFLF